MRKILVLAAAGAALAVGIPAAVALGASPGSSGAPAQHPQPDHPRDDCPEKAPRGSSAANPEI